ncbi:MAG: S8 family serine peptidase [Candidatus Thermoplasmatota archaeon]|nr:S8 family serine peptidase [Candidatus Thermoplasmatota archaeon]
MSTGPYRHLEYLPEPEDPRMLTAIDPDAPGYPPEAYGATASQAEEWRQATSDTLRDNPPRPWGMLLVMAFIAGLMMAYPTVVTYFADALTPDSKWAYEDTNIRSLKADFSLTGEGVNVCIVDTGIDISHPDFSEVNLLGFKDFISGSNSPKDYGNDFHGTMMAGILVAKGSTFTGAAPDVGLIIAAALDEDGQTQSESAVAQAISWCWQDMDADIISLSLGGDPNRDDPLGSQTASAVSNALDHGVFVVAAAGNSGGTNSGVIDVSIPANVDGVIAVGAVDENENLWNQTAIGSLTEGTDGETRLYPHQKPEVSAPGVEIVSTSNPDLAVPYSVSTGTSDSTVFVTGALALILERHGDALTRNGLNMDRSDIDLVKRALADSCRASTIQNDQHHPKYGYGMLDASAWEVAVADEIAIRGDT